MDTGCYLFNFSHLNILDIIIQESLGLKTVVFILLQPVLTPEATLSKSNDILTLKTFFFPSKVFKILPLLQKIPK